MLINKLLFAAGFFETNFLAHNSSFNSLEQVSQSKEEPIDSDFKLPQERILVTSEKDTPPYDVKNILDPSDSYPKKSSHTFSSLPMKSEMKYSQFDTRNIDYSPQQRTHLLNTNVSRTSNIHPTHHPNVNNQEASMSHQNRYRSLNNYPPSLQSTDPYSAHHHSYQHSSANDAYRNDPTRSHHRYHSDNYYHPYSSSHDTFRYPPQNYPRHNYLPSTSSMKPREESKPLLGTPQSNSNFHQVREENDYMQNKNYYQSSYSPPPFERERTARSRSSSGNNGEVPHHKISGDQYSVHENKNLQNDIISILKKEIFPKGFYLQKTSPITSENSKRSKSSSSSSEEERSKKNKLNRKKRKSSPRHSISNSYSNKSKESSEDSSDDSLIILSSPVKMPDNFSVAEKIRKTTGMLIYYHFYVHLQQNLHKYTLNMQENFTLSHIDFSPILKLQKYYDAGKSAEENTKIFLEGCKDLEMKDVLMFYTLEATTQIESEIVNRVASFASTHNLINTHNGMRSDNSQKDCLQSSSLSPFELQVTETK